MRAAIIAAIALLTMGCRDPETLERDLQFQLRKTEALKGLAVAACPCGVAMLETDSRGWLDKLSCHPCARAK